MTSKSAADYRASIKASGKSIYDPIEVGDPDLWIPTPELTGLLNENLVGTALGGMALRTRSKFVKRAVCEALGYPTPDSFRKEQPRFPGQQLDVYVQKSSNLQIWNEELSPDRRYALIQVSGDDEILSVKVVNGQQLAVLDTTGTITTKYQARIEIRDETNELISARDTETLLPFIKANIAFPKNLSPTNEPEAGWLLPIQEIFNRLTPLIGRSFKDPGISQDRNRGAELHRLVCECLGYHEYGDTGQFPDIRHQLLELKLQTSPTIDLGLVLPESADAMDIQRLESYQPSHRDTRYAIFYGATDGSTVSITHLFVTTGADFFRRFKQFEGRVKNGKIQIPLPRGFFD